MFNRNLQTTSGQCDYTEHCAIKVKVTTGLFSCFLAYLSFKISTMLKYNNYFLLTSINTVFKYCLVFVKLGKFKNIMVHMKSVMPD